MFPDPFCTDTYRLDIISTTFSYFSLGGPWDLISMLLRDINLNRPRHGLHPPINTRDHR